MQIVFGFGITFNRSKRPVKSDESLFLSILKFLSHWDKTNCCIFCLSEMKHRGMSLVKGMGPGVNLPVVDSQLLSS